MMFFKIIIAVEFYQQEVKSLKEEIAKCASKEEMAVVKKGYLIHHVNNYCYHNYIIL